MAKMVDAPHLGCGTERRAGSSPAGGTKRKRRPVTIKEALNYLMPWILPRKGGGSPSLDFSSALTSSDEWI